ncbi:MAG: glycoside hydrolase family 2, partial [Kiritimatiellae bacterium]|nr:glycoside hydrolase family 2 [Kiritimatiellia bacterium]
WEGITDSWAEHNFCAAGGRKYPRFMTTRYGEPKNFPDFVRKAQLMNYEMHRAIYEGRIGRMFAPMQGVLLWMSVPAQPSLIWQMIPYDLDPHATYFGIKKACETRHIFFSESADGGIIQVVNHDPVPLSGSAHATFYHLDGHVAGEADWPVAVGGVSVATLGTVRWPEGLSQVHFIGLELRDTQRRVIADNFYWHNRACNPAKVDDLRDDNRLVGYDDLKALNHLPQVTLDVVSAKTESVDGKRVVTVELANTSDAVALMIHLQLHGKTGGNRILPTSYSDNYFSLPPKKSRRVQMICPAASLKDDEPVVYLDGWNVTVAKGERVVPNETAAVDAPQWAHQKGFTFLPRPQKPQATVRINCGGYTRGNFAQDPGFLEGWCGFQTEDMDLSETKMAGPSDIYRSVRWGESTYTCRMAATNHPHTVRLHWAEHSREKGPGKCRFNVKANGKVILGDFDAAGAAGGLWKGVVVEVKHIQSDAEGKIVLTFENGKRIANEQRDARINGIEVIPE